MPSFVLHYIKATIDTKQNILGRSISLTEGAMLGIVSVIFTECVPAAMGQDNSASFATSQRLKVLSKTVIIDHFTFAAIVPFVTTSAVNNT